MPWRDETNIDNVDYSDKELSKGPASLEKNIEKGKIIEFNLTDGEEFFEAELQFWRPLKADIDVENPGESAAGYFAWRIGDQSGQYGVFDGHHNRIWLGLDHFSHNSEKFSCINIGRAWRKKLHVNEFVDKIYSRYLQNPLTQESKLNYSSKDNLVSKEYSKTTVYEIKVKSHGEEYTLLIQLWKPKNCEAVFIATEHDEIFIGTKGIIEKNAILTDSGLGISLKEETVQKLLDESQKLRSDYRTLKITEKSNEK